ncbi:MAG: hypothetical protein DWQ01_17840 [Planctomycetota bacterium]|nr:MAG: hypothetical protein DWQ01_17840 [Planctomycetota bacterium]
MKRFRWILLVLLLPLAACMAPAPQAAVDTPFGRVRAADPETAHSVAIMLQELHPQVAAVLPGSEIHFPEIWVQERLQVQQSHFSQETGLTVFGADDQPLRIHLKANSPRLRQTLAHELVHALMGESWEPLPGVLEEGICEVIAAKLNPDMAPSRAAGLLASASAWFGGLEGELLCTVPRREPWTRDTLLSLSFRIESERTAPDHLGFRDILEFDNRQLHQRWRKGEIPDYHGLGYLLVAWILRDHDIDVLFQLSLDAKAKGLEKVPVGWVLRLARIYDQVGLAHASTKLLGDEELEEMAYHSAVEFARRCASFFPKFFPGHTASEFMDLGQPRLRIGQSQEQPLTDIPAFRAELDLSWFLEL